MTSTVSFECNKLQNYDSERKLIIQAAFLPREREREREKVRVFVEYCAREREREEEFKQTI